MGGYGHMRFFKKTRKLIVLHKSFGHGTFLEIWDFELYNYPSDYGFLKEYPDSYVAVVSHSALAAEVESYVQALLFPPSHLKINL